MIDWVSIVRESRRRFSRRGRPGNLRGRKRGRRHDDQYYDDEAQVCCGCCGAGAQKKSDSPDSAPAPAVSLGEFPALTPCDSTPCIISGRTTANEVALDRKSDWREEPATTALLTDLDQQEEDEWEYEDVALARGSHGLGFSIAGGHDAPHIGTDPSIFVTKLIPGGVACEDGRVRVGDVIVSVNGVSVRGVAHEQAVEALKRAGSTVQLRTRRRRPPRPEHLLSVELLRGVSGLGFSIAGGVGNQHIPGDNGIYITRLMDGGACQLDGRLAVGDRLVAVDAGRGEQQLLNVSHEEAVSALKSSSDRVILTVAKPAARAPRLDPTPAPPVPAVPATVRQGPTGGGRHRAQAVPLTEEDDVFTASPRHSDNHVGGGVSEFADPCWISTPLAVSVENVARESRTVTLSRSRERGLGFNIVGGEECAAIYVSHLHAAGRAELSGQLHRGDQILAVNGAPLGLASHEQAAAALKGAGHTVSLQVQYRPEEYNRFEAKVHQLKQQMMSGTLRTTHKRSLYVRTLFDYDPRADDDLPSRGLPFSFGDILHVTNASDEQWWQAKRLSPQGAPQAVGIIPSPHRWERKQHARGRSVGFRGRPTNLQSTFDRKKRNYAFSRKFPFMKSKEDVTVKSDDHCDSEHSVTNVSEGDERSLSDETVLSYQPVQHVEVSYCRPVILLGELKDRINEDLISQYPDDFGSCVPHTTRAPRPGEEDHRDYHFVFSRDQMESDIRNHLFIEAGQFNDNLYGTSLASVRQVAEEQRKHCILDVSSGAIRRLHAARLYPIAVFVRARSIEQIMAWNKRLTDDQAKEALEKNHKIEAEFSEYFTAIVTVETPEEVYETVKDVIREQGTNRIWIPSDEKL